MRGKKLRRSRHDRLVCGLIGGIGDYLGMDATILRIIFVIMCWSGFPIVLYFLLSMIIPLEGNSRYNDRYYEDSYRNSGSRPRKVARKVDKDDEEWSDF